MFAKRFLLLACALTAGLCAQAPPAVDTSNESPETVAGTVDGVPVTIGELQLVLAGSPKELQATLQNDKEELLRYYGFMRKLAAQAEEAKLDQKPPYSDRLRLMRQSILAEARMDTAYLRNTVSNEDQKAYYEANKDHYAWAKTKMIYISFSDSAPAKQSQDAKPVLNEAQAQAKAAKVAAAARSGKDFVALVKENSEHQESVANDGDFGLIEGSGKYPDEVKQAVLKAGKGGIAGPVRLANGFYIFRIEDAGVKPYEDVQQEIFKQIREERWRAWMEKTRQSVTVTVGK